ncbi:uncharacterized protein LOC108743157 [Agrilus planipennis]|uniref:Uncharacterized protein LOC108743157 n=1 Tax=Agrilus planipennis TaxID=224129 RepID=A0A1W4XP05_AGRPL|nr:uncharacterized protein LOC108743157 [Agrilus planipennis]
MKFKTILELFLVIFIFAFVAGVESKATDEHILQKRSEPNLIQLAAKNQFQGITQDVVDILRSSIPRSIGININWDAIVNLIPHILAVIYYAFSSNWCLILTNLMVIVRTISNSCDA